MVLMPLFFVWIYTRAPVSFGSQRLIAGIKEINSKAIIIQI